MQYGRNKPKLVFFMYRYDPSLPEFLLVHRRDHVKCLAEFFDVTTIDYDCDYQQICDLYQPDLTLFESAFNVSFSYCKRPRIINTGACPKVPKLGFLHSDSFSEGRAGFFSDMDHWGIETFFSIATTAAEHVPEISNNLFIWPNFIDAEIYHDYREGKNIPILFTGSRNTIYPWRRKIFELVSKHYPSLICPHPGFRPPETAIQVMVGEAYARMLNASWFAPACGTVAREVVRKHFEVPACKACLIAEKSPALEAAGFIDMTNCVFAEESNILDKLHYLFRNSDRLKDIIDAGYQLVHTHHTLKHRDQIFQWFNLQRNLKPDEKIVQTSPFGPLRIVDKWPGPVNSHVVSRGLDLVLLHQGDEHLWRGNYAEAESLYLKCLKYVPWMPEPKLRLTLCNLYTGNPKRALSWIIKPIQFTLLEYKAIDPDPVEWTYFIVTLLCLGKLKSAARYATEFSWLHHPELDRVRLVTGALTGRESALSLPAEDAPKSRISIHRLPDRNMQDWIRHLCLMLTACGQGSLAKKVISGVFTETPLFKTVHRTRDASAETTANEEAHKRLLRTLVTEENLTTGYFKRHLLFYRRVPITIKGLVKFVLHRLEATYGSFLPYHLSIRKNDEFFQAIQNLIQRDNIKLALVVGATLKEDTTAALLAGARRNNNKPTVNCLGASKNHSLQTRFSKEPVKWYTLSSSSPEHVSKELEEMVKEIKEANQTSFFDVLLVDGSELGGRAGVPDALKKELGTAMFVILDDVNAGYNHENYETLVRNPEYTLVDYNLDLRKGYAIFEKQRSIGVEGVSVPCSTIMLSE